MREIYPYVPLSGDVTLQIGDVELDGLPAGIWTDVAGRAIDLSNSERAKWTHLRAPVTLVGPPSELAERRANGGDPKAYVLVHCGFTNARQSVLLKPEGDGSRWVGNLELERAFWFGKIEVEAHVTDLVAPADVRRIGSADIWTLQLDDLPDAPISGALTVRWADFEDKEPKPPCLKEAAGEPYFHHIDPREPVLYLNSAFPGLEPLLRNGPRPPAEQALHDQVRSAIAVKFFMAAASAALAALEDPEEGDVPEWPKSDWQKDLLEGLFRRMYPKRSAEDALAEVLTRLKTEDGAGAVQNMLIRAVDQQVGASRLLRSSIKSLGHKPEADLLEA